MKTKTCTKCKKEYPATTEYFYKSARDGLISRCRACASEDARKLYHRKKNKKVGLDDKCLNLKLIIGEKYKVKYKTGHTYYSGYTEYVATLELVTKDLIGLRHKTGYMETFMLKDLLLKEVEVEIIERNRQNR